MNEEVNKILTEMAGEVDLSAVQPGPGMTVPVTSKRPDQQVEVVPGIMVSQKLIDEAVRLTADPATVAAVEDAERRRTTRLRENMELAQDIAASRTMVQGILQRMREPLKYDEKFVSYDTMPAALQRVVKAYIEAEEANRNLTEAVAALGKDLQPPAAKAE